MLSSVRPSQDQLDDLVLQLLPAQGQWTEDAYLWLSEQSNRLLEYTDGFIEVLSMPTERHQILLLFLYEALREYSRRSGGKVLVAPLRLKVGERRYREPDILMLCNARDPRRQNRFWLGADLVVEVICPDRPERDLVEKRQDYACAGIPEYWIVDPDKSVVLVLTLTKDVYVQAGTYGKDQELRSPLLEGFSLPVGALFQAE